MCLVSPCPLLDGVLVCLDDSNILHHFLRAPLPSEPPENRAVVEHGEVILQEPAHHAQPRSIKEVNRLCPSTPFPLFLYNGEQREEEARFVRVHDIVLYALVSALHFNPTLTAMNESRIVPIPPAIHISTLVAKLPLLRSNPAILSCIFPNACSSAAMRYSCKCVCSSNELNLSILHSMFDSRFSKSSSFTSYLLLIIPYNHDNVNVLFLIYAKSCSVPQEH